MASDEEHESLVRAVDSDENVYDLKRVVRTPDRIEYYFNEELIDINAEGTFEVIIDGKIVVLKELGSS